MFTGHNQTPPQGASPEFHGCFGEHYMVVSRPMGLKFCMVTGSNPTEVLGLNIWGSSWSGRKVLSQS